MGSYQWVVRGVDQALAKRLVELAAQQRRKTGEVLNEALAAYLDQSEDTAPTNTTSPLEARVMALEARLEAMAVELHQRADGKPVDAVEPALVAADTPMTPEALPDPPQKRQTRKPWAEADDAVLRRVHAEGGIQADAARELGRPTSVVNGKWKALGLPVMPRKGRTVTRRHRLPE